MVEDVDYIEFYVASKLVIVEEEPVQQVVIDFQEVEMSERFIVGSFEMAGSHRFAAILLKNYFKKTEDKIPWRVGSWYRVPTAVFQNGRYSHFDESVPEFTFLRGEIIFDSPVHFERVKALPPKFLELSEDELSELSILPKISTKNIELVVVDCGQGNWNELLLDNCVICYDLGGAVQNNRQIPLSSLVQTRFANYLCDEIYVVLSHWHLDHFKALLGCTKAEFLKIKGFIAPGKFPASTHAKSLYLMLKLANVPIVLLPAGQQRQNTTKCTLELASTHGCIDIYRATPSRRPNHGIMLTVNGNFKTGLLTGDHNYFQVIDVVTRCNTQSRCVLVVPHHGGNGGTINVQAWNNEFVNCDSAISVGSNIYGHPRQSVLTSLSRFKNNVINRTDISGDISYNL
ncbi:hypothetical protein [Halodesulfovibrio aestuarii]|uniref:hypothetical protein n=1 Tax=Halodesulfovibrio aestuarii TaxID=126333 RepID=UPI0004245681